MLDKVANNKINSFFFKIQANIMMVHKEYAQLLQRPANTSMLTFFSQSVSCGQRLQHNK